MRSSSAMTSERTAESLAPRNRTQTRKKRKMQDKPRFHVDTRRAFVNLAKRRRRSRYQSNTLSQLLERSGKGFDAYALGKPSYSGLAMHLLEKRGRSTEHEERLARKALASLLESRAIPDDIECLIANFVGSFVTPKSVDDLLYLLCTTKTRHAAQTPSSSPAFRLYRWKWHGFDCGHDARRGLVFDFGDALFASAFAQRLSAALPGAFVVRAQNASSFRYTVQLFAPDDFAYCAPLVTYDWPQLSCLAQTSTLLSPCSSTMKTERTERTKSEQQHAFEMETRLRRILSIQEAKRFPNVDHISFGEHCQNVLLKMRTGVGCYDGWYPFGLDPNRFVGPPALTDSLLVVWAKEFPNLRLSEAMGVLLNQAIALRHQFQSDLASLFYLNHAFVESLETVGLRLQLSAMFPVRECSRREPFVRPSQGLNRR